MAKKKGLFTILKRIFISEAHSEKKEKRRRWTFWKLKVKKRLPSITAPPEQATRNESLEEQKEESVSDVGEVSQVSCSHQQLDSIEKLEGSTSPETSDLVVQYQMFLNIEEEVLAATRIQTAFRGHLARKALRALKGIVKLQAYIRGRAVRRQAMTTLKCLQSVVNIQSQVCGKRTQIPRGPHRDYDQDSSNKFQIFTENILKVETNGQKRWDDSLLTKEEAQAVFMSKKEASLRRERIKEYAVTHRKSAESYQRRSNTKWKYWLDEWVDTQRTKSKELEDLDLSLKAKPKEETLNKTPRNSSPRRLVNNSHRRQVSIGEEEQQQNLGPVSVTTPTYMVATESAKAKSRSLSSPRIRPRSFDTQSESYSPYKNKLCLTTSVMSEAPSKVRIGNSTRPSSYQQRSPGLKGFSIGPLKSCNGRLLCIIEQRVKAGLKRHRFEKEEIEKEGGGDMSLVDYDDSSSDDDVLPAAEKKEPLPLPPQPQQKPSVAQSLPRNTQRCINEKEKSDELPQLPDALFLLESPTITQVSGGGDHASVVEAAMAQSALRKRELNGSHSSLPRRPKLPRGNLPHSKNIPDTFGNVLVPPQLKGRSNVATEDIGRLFVKKRQDSSKATSPNQD
ncbi:unnamed protein product [Microthlaspi erraticum]|uniref:DUF4005 domain-containing protein n=1 Tax=Microthlaspi erraticum TaxID=1685480 RepID=A0A6D2IUL0_9BRAS|nr:unnamed protein product [Microthlaspi erraticum]